MEPHGDWALHEVTLPDEWGLLLYSDGIVDARTAPGSRARFGVAGLRAAVSRLWERRATAATDLASLVDAVQAGQASPFDDDVTLLLLASDGTAPDE